jgi:probable F420-dependent oxidoreductase
MVEVAGEVADGLFEHPFTTLPFIEAVQEPALAAGLARSRRSRADFSVSSMVLTISGRDEAEIAAADLAVRKLLAFYASTPAYERVLAVHGWEALLPELNRMSKEGRWDEMTRRVSDEMVAAFAVKAPPDEIPRLIAARCAGRADRVTLYAPYPSAASLWPPIVRAIQQMEVRT